MGASNDELDDEERIQMIWRAGGCSTRPFGGYYWMVFDCLLSYHAQMGSFSTTSFKGHVLCFPRGSEHDAYVGISS